MKKIFFFKMSVERLVLHRHMSHINKSSTIFVIAANSKYIPFHDGMSNLQAE